MGDAGAADTIEQVVRAVLDAVDARLDAIRHDLATFATEVERKHHLVLDALAALERRTPSRDELQQLEARQRLDVAENRDRIGRLIERLEEIRRLGIASTGELPALSPTPPSGIALASPHVPVSPGAPAAPAAAHPLVPDDLGEISRPLIRPGTTTGAVPLVGDTGVHRLTSLPVPPLKPTVIHDDPHAPAATAPAVPPAPAAAPAAPPAQPELPPKAATAAAAHDEIDIEALTRLLDERLGHLTLPPAPERRPE